MAEPKRRAAFWAWVHSLGMAWCSWAYRHCKRREGGVVADDPDPAWKEAEPLTA